MKIHDFKLKKANHSKISMLTCYDYPSARMLSESKIDCALVGDSVAMAVHGHPNTLTASLDMMVLHTQAVARGLSHPFLVTDLPFLLHKSSKEHLINGVQKIMQAGAHGIKIEGGDEHTCEVIEYLVQAGVPVMGHIGLTPQSLHSLGGFVVQGKSKAQEDLLLEQALKLEKAGCFALVLECIKASLGKTITETISIPTIGIGAGSDTDGQVLVWHDLLGLQDEFRPKFIKQFLPGKNLILDAINAYQDQVVNSHFPQIEHSY